MGQLIRTFFWVPGKAEEAANFWVSIFPDSKIDTVNPLTDDGSVTVVEFSLGGQEFLAMNAGDAPAPSFNVSHLIRAKDQTEVDRLWDALTADGGKPDQCGWLTDKFGVAWQVIPDEMYTLMSDPDPVRAQRAGAAMMQMSKIDLAVMRAAMDAEA
jgi:predicted 3-demethylubiquinone-9 3-methyltransferase (glyoxalase superfamily)